MESQPLATELIRELRTHNKRWFITALVELVVIVLLTIVIFIWSLTFPVSETTIEASEDNADYIG